MRYQIRYTPDAIREIEEVWDGVWEVSRDSDVADRYVRGLTEKIRNKELFPESGIPLRYRGVFTGIYSVNYKAYKVFYRISENWIDVLRIILAKRDYMVLLFGEPEETEE